MELMLAYESNDDSVSIDKTPIKVGQLMTPSETGFFATQFVTVTGVGTTAADLSLYPFTGITTSQLITVPYITVDTSYFSNQCSPE